VEGRGARVVSTGAEVREVLRRPVSLGFVIWIVVGLVVASNKGFLSRLDSLSGILSAVLAVLAWPLVLLDVHVAI
jgi:hypothetical protein